MAHVIAVAGKGGVGKTMRPFDPVSGTEREGTDPRSGRGCEFQFE